VRDYAALQLQRHVRRIIGRCSVLASVLVPAVEVVGRTQARYRLHFPEEIVEHIAPVAEHVEDDAAAILLAVVPGWALSRLPCPLEYPIAELAAHRQDRQKAVHERLELEARTQSLSAPLLTCPPPRYRSSASAVVVATGFSQ
jgi:hypothetical protein